MKTISQRTDLLLNARHAIATPLDPDAVLRTLAEILVPRVADWCVIDLIEESGGWNRTILLHHETDKQPLLETLRGRYPLNREASNGPAQVVRIGAAKFVPVVSDLGLVALAQDADHLAILAELGARSVIFAPLLAWNYVLGVMTLVRTQPHNEFVPADAALARSLGVTAGMAVAHARVYSELQLTSRAKDQFVAMVGHELRNPVGALLTAASVLERLARGDEREASVRSVISRQARHLARLVDDLLDVVHLNSGKVTLQPEPVDLGQIAEGYLETLRFSGATAQRGIIFEAERTVVRGDLARLEQILANLLDNAVKYTPQGGRILVRIKPEGDDAVLSVEDTGSGIASETLPHVFEPFAQGRPPLGRHRVGFGLGLTVVRRLVELHGGSVRVESFGPGEGTTVTVRLPLDSAALAAPSARPGAASGTRRRILIVEDEEDARETLRQLLELEGHVVEVAEDGEQAVDLAARHQPEVMLVDIGLPGISGYDVARQVRALRQGADIHLVATTAYGQPADRVRGKEAGFDAYLIKPIGADELARSIDAKPRPAA